MRKGLHKHEPKKMQLEDTGEEVTVCSICEKVMERTYKKEPPQLPTDKHPDVREVES